MLLKRTNMRVSLPASDGIAVSELFSLFSRRGFHSQFYKLFNHTATVGGSAFQLLLSAMAFVELLGLP
jgi:hypothetical protein